MPCKIIAGCGRQCQEERVAHFSLASLLRAACCGQSGGLFRHSCQGWVAARFVPVPSREAEGVDNPWLARSLVELSWLLVTKLFESFLALPHSGSWLLEGA